MQHGLAQASVLQNISTSYAGWYVLYNLLPSLLFPYYYNLPVFISFLLSLMIYVCVCVCISHT